MLPDRRGEGVPPLRCKAILALPNHAATHPSRAKAVECRPAAEGTEKEGTNRQPTTDYRLLPLGFAALGENHAAVLESQGGPTASPEDRDEEPFQDNLAQASDGRGWPGRARGRGKCIGHRVVPPGSSKSPLNC